MDTPRIESVDDAIAYITEAVDKITEYQCPSKLITVSGSMDNVELISGNNSNVNDFIVYLQEGEILSNITTNIHGGYNEFK